jgi:hypothetical protein
MLITFSFFTLIFPNIFISFSFHGSSDMVHILEAHLICIILKLSVIFINVFKTFVAYSISRISYLLTSPLGKPDKSSSSSSGRSFFHDQTSISRFMKAMHASATPYVASNCSIIGTMSLSLHSNLMNVPSLFESGQPYNTGTELIFQSQSFMKNLASCAHIGQKTHDLSACFWLNH